MIVVRENSEGEYAGVGGRAHAGHPAEVGIQVDVFTRAGVERVARYSFELARSRRGRLASISSTACMIALLAAFSPRWSSIIAPAQTAPTGLALPVPAMSGADPCTGSNMPGWDRSGLMLALAAMPIPP